VTQASSGAGDRVGRAERLIEIRRYRDAIDLLSGDSQIVADWHAVMLRAQAYLGLHEAQRAVDEARRAITLDPNREWSYRLLAYSLLAQSRASGAGEEKWPRLQEAERAAREAMRLAPSNFLTHLVAGEVLFERRIIGEARHEAERARDLAPNAVGPWILLSRVEIVAKRPQAAERAAKEALRIDPTNAAARNNLGASLQNRGRMWSAARHYGTAARSDPVNEVVRSNLRKVGLFVLFRLSLVPVMLLVLVPGGVLVLVAWYFAAMRYLRGSKRRWKWLDDRAVRVGFRLAEWGLPSAVVSIASILAPVMVLLTVAFVLLDPGQRTGAVGIAAIYLACNAYVGLLMMLRRSRA
jgi:tetratricopeptide (TPR) repeat protein